MTASELYELLNPQGELLVRWEARPPYSVPPRLEDTYFPQRARAVRMLAWHEEQGHKPHVGLVGRRSRAVDDVAASSVLWAWLERPEARERLRAFRPAPSVILLYGAKQLAIWGLDRVLPVLADPAQDWLTRANKRLAYHLKAYGPAADPAWLMPFYGFERGPREISVYPPARIVGWLSDPPPRRRLHLVDGSERSVPRA